MVSRSARLLSAARTMGTLAGLKMRFTGAVVFGYHDVAPEQDIWTDYTVTPELLRCQLEDARRYGLTFVTLEEITQRRVQRSPLDGLAAVVFDDALLGVYRYAAEVLADLKVPGTLFPLTQGLGQPPAWWPGSARTLTSQEMTELRELGWTVGSHTRTHASLPSLSPDRQYEEIVVSKAELESSIGRSVTSIAYPFGHHDQRVRDLCREAGYDVGFTFLNGRISSDLDQFRLPRLTMTMQSHGPRWAYHLARTAGSWPDTQLDRVDGVADE